MAEFLNKNLQTFVETRQEDYKKKTLQDYIVSFGTPQFVSYYKINRDLTSQDDTFKNLDETIGTDSSIIYDKILDLPIYKFTNHSGISFEETDFGVEASEITFEGYLLPETIKPNIDDIIIVNNSELLFRINNIETSNLEGVSVYKLSMHLFSKNKTEVEEQKTEEDSVFIYDPDENHSSGYIIKDKTVSEIQELEYLYNTLLDDFKDSYMLKGYIIQDNIFDVYLNNFLQRNNILKEELSLGIKDLIKFMKNINYKESLFNYIERRDNDIPSFLERLEVNYYLDNRNPNNIFRYDSKKPSLVQYSEELTDINSLVDIYLFFDDFPIIKNQDYFDIQSPLEINKWKKIFKNYMYKEDFSTEDLISAVSVYQPSANSDIEVAIILNLIQEKVKSLTN